MTLTTERIRNLYTWAYAWRTADDPDEGDLSAVRASNAAEFDAWLAAHDAEVAATTAASIVTKVRQNCTITMDAHDRGGDFLIRAVAEWIENPPEWVGASWVTRQEAAHG
jgi:hypothetical protein